MMFICEV